MKVIYGLLILMNLTLFWVGWKKATEAHYIADVCKYQQNKNILYINMIDERMDTIHEELLETRDDYSEVLSGYLFITSDINDLRDDINELKPKPKPLQK